MSKRERAVSALKNLEPFMIGMCNPINYKQWHAIIKSFRSNLKILKNIPNSSNEFGEFHSKLLKGTWIFFHNNLKYITNTEITWIPGIQDIQRCVLICIGIIETFDPNEMATATTVCGNFFGLDWVKFLPMHRKHVNPALRKHYHRMFLTVNGDMSHHDPQLYENYISELKKIYHLVTHTMFIPRGVWIFDYDICEYVFERKKYQWKFVPARCDTVCLSRTNQSNPDANLIFMEDVIKGFADPCDRQEYIRLFGEYQKQFPRENLSGAWISDTFDRANRMRWHSFE